MITLLPPVGSEPCPPAQAQGDRRARLCNCCTIVKLTYLLSGGQRFSAEEVRAYADRAGAAPAEDFGSLADKLRGALGRGKK